MNRTRSLLVAWLLGVAASLGCSSGAEPAAAPAVGCPRELCTPVSPQLPPEQKQQEADLRRKLDAVATLSAEQLVASRSVPFEAGLALDLASVKGYELIKKSSLAPSAAEEEALSQRGFSLSGAKQFPTFTYGYQTLYLEDLPVYISADSILHAAHKSFDKALMRIESGALSGAVDEMLASMRQRLGQPVAGLTADNRADLDLFLAVGASLLAGQVRAPVAGASAEQISDLFARASAAQGTGQIRLFGEPREVDFSQFKPRGHYEGDPLLERYFRAMMWFGRTEFRLIETEPDGSQVFRRRQLEAAFGLAALMDDGARARFARTEAIIGAFAGEHDSMTIDQLGKLLADLGLTDASGLASLGDDALAQAILTGNHGAQRIASQLMVNGTRKTLPLHRAFQLFGQRYTLDSHVFSNVVFDRVQGGAVKRMMPSPLDAAYAAFGNDQAASLLQGELKTFNYAPDLESMRILADDHGASYWDGSLYTLWLSSIRSLSPGDDIKMGASSGLPAVARSEAWGRRLLNTQLASWAELRHDTLLYAKQSYTGGAACEFPDAYVDPYPAFYAQIARYAERGDALTAELDFGNNGALKASLHEHFLRLRKVATTLHQMALAQRSGAPFSAEQMAFVNDAVVIKTEHQGCADVTTASGWYPGLFLGGSDDALLYDPTIADVHTQPTDEVGNPVGRVLHVGTDGPRRMIVVVDTCSGPRAYAGLASSYHEHVTQDFSRLSDSEWAPMAKPPSPPWFGDLAPLPARTLAAEFTRRPATPRLADQKRPPSDTPPPSGPTAGAAHHPRLASALPPRIGSWASTSTSSVLAPSDPTIAPLTYATPRRRSQALSPWAQRGVSTSAPSRPTSGKRAWLLALTMEETR